MLKTLKYQQKAVRELVEKTIGLLNLNRNRHKLVFQAPTGSGKTVMASELLSILTDELSQRSDCRYNEVAFIWIAPNKLHEQSYFKMKSIFSETRTLSPVMYDELDSSDGYIRPGEILFVNWESINKDNAVIVRDTETCRSLYDITRRTQDEIGIPIIVIIDEEHMFGGKNAKKSEKVLKHIEPKLEIRISATPITLSAEKVYIPRQKVVEEEMIKEGIILNPAIDKHDSQAHTLNQYLVKEALDKRNELAEAYKELGININPLLLIQLPNDSSDKLTTDDNTIIEEAKEYLDKVKGINVANGKLAIWLSGTKENVNGIEKEDSITEVLLFKQAIALGWDCPRASVLLIFRKLDSFQFTVQTVGRILRMPQQKFYTNEILNIGYVYTDLSKDQIQIVADDMDYISTLHAVRRQNLNNVTLSSVYIERTSCERNRLGPDFKKVLRDVITEMFGLKPLQYSFNFFDDEEDNNNTEVQESNVSKNRKLVDGKLKLDVRNISITLPKDVEFTGESEAIQINSQTKFVRTYSELTRALLIYCRQSIEGFEKSHSTEVLANYLVELLEEFFEVFDSDAKKIILYHENKPSFTDIISKALNRYKKILEQRQLNAKEKGFTNYKWEVPEERTYNESTNVIEDSIINHALEPFVRLKNCSNAEKGFILFLENNTKFIDWWYKNGDSGKQHYAISYFNNNGERSLFYVDFIVRMKNGQLFLFDTKTEGSDQEAVNKHNALIDYITEENKTGKNLKGGIIIGADENWRYSSFKINNTEDTVNWECFYPSEYKD